jgi:hypothetical protein
MPGAEKGREAVAQPCESRGLLRIFFRVQLAVLICRFHFSEYGVTSPWSQYVCRVFAIYREDGINSSADLPASSLIRTAYIDGNQSVGIANLANQVNEVKDLVAPTRSQSQDILETS